MKITKNILLAASLFCLAMALTGCMKDDLDGQACPTDGDGKTQIALSIGDQTVVETYSVATSDERHLRDVYVLVFDKSTPQKRYVYGQRISGTNVTDNGEQKPSVLLSGKVPDGYTIVVLGNTFCEGTPEEQGMVAGTTTIDQINQVFRNLDNQPATNLPMSGTMVYNASNPHQVCNMVRAWAKVELRLNIADGDDVTGTFKTAEKIDFLFVYIPYHVEGYDNKMWYTIYNPTDDILTPDGLTVKPGVNSWENSPGVPSYIGYVPEFPAATKYFVNGQSTMSSLPNDTDFAAKRTHAIIEMTIGGVKTFYRLDFYDKEAKKYLDIKRNHHYIINVTKVKSFGYSSRAEAEANPPSNIEYEIVVTGPNDNVIDSNGQYAMALEYDKLIAYAAPTTVFTLKAKAILGEGLTTLPATNSITASSGGIILTGSTTLTTSEQDIKFTMSGTSGTITVKLGNLTREIAITRGGALDAHYNHRTIAGGFSSVKWVRNDNNATSTINGTTSMTIHTPENVTPTNASALGTATVEPVFTAKYAEGYVLSSVGRTKVMIEQTVPEYIGWFGGEPNQSGTTYYQKRLIVETIEEGSWDNTAKDYTGTLTMPWYSSAVGTGPQDIERGYQNTQTIMGFTTPTAYAAAYNCYMKNDADGDGVVTAAEYAAARWYLPAQNQLLGAWISYPNFNCAWTAYNYWSSTELSNGTSCAWNVNFYNGYMNYDNSKMDCYSVRCVREI